MAAHCEVQASHVAESITQRLGKEIKAIVTSATMIAEVDMRVAVEGMRMDVQAQID